MGELIETGGDIQSLYGLLSAAVSVLALGLYALLKDSQQNDDDDSNPGGGLMQPVS